MHLLFVYGTLMRGYGNNVLLRDSDFLGEAVTTDGKFSMVTGGFPMVYAGGSSNIKGELYWVDDVVLQSCDRLEGHPNWYRRERISVDAAAVVHPWMYIMQGEPLGPTMEPDENNVIFWRRTRVAA